jgi:hypothetical protein
MVICFGCRAHLDTNPHALGCAVTRRAVSDAQLAEVLIRKGIVR